MMSKTWSLQAKPGDLRGLPLLLALHGSLKEAICIGIQDWVGKNLKMVAIVRYKVPEVPKSKKTIVPVFFLQYELHKALCKYLYNIIAKSE